MDAIVLCGGNGKRMGSLCQDIPKTLIKVRGKPILWFILKSLSRHNVKRVILPVGYKGEKIIQFVESVKNNFEFDIVSVETGTDTPISKRLLSVLPLSISKTLLLINGDCITDVNFSKVYTEHKKTSADLTAIFCSINSPLGLFRMENEIPISFERESKISELKFQNDTETNCYRIYSGICVIEKLAFDGFNLDDLENFEVGFFNYVMKYGKVGFFSATWALASFRDTERC